MIQKSSKQITGLKIMVIEKNPLMRLSNKCEQLNNQWTRRQVNRHYSVWEKIRKKERIVKANMGFKMQNLQCKLQFKKLQ